MRNTGIIHFHSKTDALKDNLCQDKKPVAKPTQNAFCKSSHHPWLLKGNNEENDMTCKNFNWAF